MNSHQPSHDDDDHDKDKMLPLTLSTTTAAEYGDLASLKHRLNKQQQQYPKKSQKSIMKLMNDEVKIVLKKNGQDDNCDSDTSLTDTATSAIKDFIGITTNTLTPLHLAAQNGHAPICSYLLQNGYNADLGYQYHHHTTTATPPEKNNSTPLHRACYSGALSCIQLLLQYGANDMAVDYSIGDEMTPLHKAVKGGRYLAVALLIQHFQEKQLVLRKKQKQQLQPNNIKHDDIEANDYQVDYNYIQRALEVRDKMNRTPLELAYELQSQGEDEILSLRRWDAVAGDTRADFNSCILLLNHASTKRINNEYDTILFAGRTSLSEAASSLSSSLESSTPSNLDNNNLMVGVKSMSSSYEWGKSKETIGWEDDFYNTLMKSTTMLLKSLKVKNNNVEQDIASSLLQKEVLEEHEEQKANKSNVSKDDTERGSEGDTNVSNVSSNIDNDSSNTSTFLGQPCQACGTITLSLFRYRDGRFVCRSCITSRKRHVL